ncbi:MAG TPA: spore coat protein [Anaerovoracaceae bacterium]|nr:spore coat protein [Anaerovoracaceae bacterium]
MQGQLSQKERTLLEDLKKEEDLCVKKYQNYAKQTQDAQLSQLFNRLAGEEQKHYSTVDQLLKSSGQNPPAPAQSGGQGGQSAQGAQSGQQGGAQAAQGGQQVGAQMINAQINMGKPGSGGGNNPDQYLLHDMLSMEKYVSSAYDTSVFESAQSNVRKNLQHIQQEEQNHGEQLFQYMSSHGMYQTQ